MTREQAIERFRVPVRAMRFDNGSGYVLGAGWTGSFPQPGDAEVRGTVGGRDAAGKPIVLRFIDAVRDQDQATLIYDFPKPNQTTALPKLA